MISNVARLLRSGQFPTPRLNLLRGKTVIERVDRGRVARTIVRDYGGRFVGRHATMDADRMAFQFRMSAGNIGSVNRFHPATIEPAPISSAIPPSIGLACVIDATSKTLRLVQAGDTALTDIYGILVRPWPFQQGTTSTFSGGTTFGSADPVSAQFGVWDVLRSGYIIVPIVGTPGKGDTVYVWCAVSSGAHIQGGFEASDPSGSGFHLTSAKTTFQGAPDAFGAGEIAFNV